MTVAEPIIVDTNVIVCATRMRVAQHTIAIEALQTVEAANRPVWISRQVIREYAATMTRPNSEADACVVQDVVTDMQCLSANFHVTDETNEVTRELQNLLVKYDVKGRQVHDANIVATMLAN